MIRILVDSTADFTLEELSKYNLEMIALKTRIQEKEYLDRIELSPTAFYDKLAECDEFPKTSQPSPAEFAAAYEAGIKANDELIVFTISSALSGTYQSANIAKMTSEYENIHIVDTQTGTLGAKILVLKAIQLREQGVSFPELIETIEAYKSRISLYAIVDTLEYFVMGGRLSKASGMIGTMMKLKPVLTVIDGKLEAIDKKRGTAKALARIVELMDEQGGIDLNEPVLFGYTGNDTKMDKFQNTLCEHFQIQSFDTIMVGPVVGSHAGPGARVIAYVKP